MGWPAGNPWHDLLLAHRSPLDRASRQWRHGKETCQNGPWSPGGLRRTAPAEVEWPGVKHADSGHSLDAPAVGLGTKTNNRPDAGRRVKFDGHGRLQPRSKARSGRGRGMEKIARGRDGKREPHRRPPGDSTSVPAMQRRVLVCSTGRAGGASELHGDANGHETRTG